MHNLFIERLVIESYLHRKPLLCTIELTTSCSFRCVHCYVNEKDTPVMLPTPQVISFIREIVKKGCMYIIFTGGDPLLHPDFEEIYLLARSMCNVIIFTNGYCISDKYLKLFSMYPPTRIEITLYGFTNETYLHMVGLPVFSEVLSNVEKLLKNKQKVKLKTFLTKENYMDYPLIKNYAQERGIELKVDSCIIAPINSKEHSHQVNFKTLQGILTSEPQEVCNTLRNYIENRGEKKLYKCGAGRNSVWLRADYSLTLCAFAPQEMRVSLLNISFEEAWNQIGSEIDKDIPESIRCYSCENKKTCMICPTKYYAIYKDSRENSRCEFVYEGK